MADCRRQGLFKSGDRVIAACSGGADSMALLLFLLRHRRTLEIEVQATHVNHGIRGAAAARDADFVADFCRKNGVELFLYDAVQEGIEIPPHPSEDWARGLRYGWFDELAARQEAVIATAHTMSDQAETVLFRMARGTGLHGLAGIPPRRGCYVRPMLCLTRADTEAYCAALGQHYIQDETNAEDVTPATVSATMPSRHCNTQTRQPNAALPGSAARCAPWTSGLRRRPPRFCRRPLYRAAMMRPPCAVQRDRCWTQRSTRWSAPCAMRRKVSSGLLRFLVLKGEGGRSADPAGEL